MNKLLNEAEAADFLSVQPKTLTRWRWAGKGPKFVKVGAMVRYNPADLEAYITNATVSTIDAG